MAAICPACGTANRPPAKFCMQCIAALPVAALPLEDEDMEKKA